MLNTRKLLFHTLFYYIYNYSHGITGCAHHIMRITTGYLFIKTVSHLVFEYRLNNVASQLLLSINLMFLTYPRVAVVNIATNAKKETGKRKGFCASISIDIRNAFNTAKWNICIEAMMQKKVPDNLLRMIDDYLSDRWVIYEGDKWSLKEEMTCGAPQGSRVGPLVGTSCTTISCAWTCLLERASSASQMTLLSFAPLATSGS